MLKPPSSAGTSPRASLFKVVFDNYIAVFFKFDQRTGGAALGKSIASRLLKRVCEMTLNLSLELDYEVDIQPATLEWYVSGQGSRGLTC